MLSCICSVIHQTKNCCALKNYNMQTLKFKAQLTKISVLSLPSIKRLCQLSLKQQNMVRTFSDPVAYWLTHHFFVLTAFWKLWKTSIGLFIELHTP